MSDEEDGLKQAKIPKVLKPKDRENKRLIVILERASLETVKVCIQHPFWKCLVHYQWAIPLYFSIQWVETNFSREVTIIYFSVSPQNQDWNFEGDHPK